MVNECDHRYNIECQYHFDHAPLGCATGQVSSREVAASIVQTARSVQALWWKTVAYFNIINIISYFFLFFGRLCYLRSLLTPLGCCSDI